MILFIGENDVVNNLKIKKDFKVVSDINLTTFTKKEINLIESVIFLNQPINKEFTKIFKKTKFFSLGDTNSEVVVLKLTPDVIRNFCLKEGIIKTDSTDLNNKFNVVGTIIIAILVLVLGLYGFSYSQMLSEKDNLNNQISASTTNLNSITKTNETLSTEQRNLISNLHRIRREVSNNSERKEKSTTESVIDPNNFTSLTNIIQIFASLEYFDVEILSRNFSDGVITIDINYLGPNESLTDLISYYSNSDYNVKYILNNEETKLTIIMEGVR